MHPFLARYGLLAGLVILYLVFVGTLIPIATDDIRLADVFSVDESGAAAEIRHFYSTGRLDRASFKYGSLFYYVLLGVLHLYGVFAPVSDQVILIVLRSFGALSGAGCIALVYLLGRRLYDSTAGAAAAIIVATSSVFLRWAVESHPDLPQMLCICAFLWTIVSVSERPEPRSVVLAAVWAALAFNVKYAGLFLTPILGATILLIAPGNTTASLADRLKEVERWRLVGLAAIAFLVTVGITNPYAVIKYEAFVESLQSERKIMAFGHTFKTSGGAFAWLELVARVSGFLNVLVLVCSAAWMVTLRHRPRPAVITYLAWILGYVLYLIVFSQLIRPRHALPVLPAIAVLGGGAYRFLWQQLGSLEYGTFMKYAAPVLLVAATAQAVPSSVDLVETRLARRDGQDEIVAGRWLAENYDADTSVLYDSYAYVPGKFRDVARTFGMTYLAIEHFRPKVLVVRDAIVSDYADTSKARESRIGRVAHLDSHYFYRYLKEGRLDEYRLVQSFPTLEIYEATEAITPRDTPWPRLMAMFGSGKALGVAKARGRMSDAHLIAGRHAEASEQRRLANRSRNAALDRFNNARSLLAERDLEGARATFDEVLTMVASRPDSYRAAIRQHVSRTLFEAGYYPEAIAEARRVLATYESLQETHFELAIFLLAAGETAASDSAFSAATKRYGSSVYARSLLSQLEANDIQPEAARRAIEKHFSR